MPTLQQQIVERFLASLAKSGGWDRERLGKLRELMTAEKPPKADDFVSVFSMSAGGDIE
jgi:hypothetical protein